MRNVVALVVLLWLPVVPATQKSEPPTVVSVTVEPVEVNDTQWRMAWQLELQNPGRRPVRINEAIIEFLDANGDVVADTSQNALEMPAGTTQMFRGESLLEASIAATVSTARATLRYAGRAVKSPEERAAGEILRLETRHRHTVTDPQATLVLTADSVSFDESDDDAHDFSIGVDKVVKFSASVLSGPRKDLRLILEFSEETTVGTELTFSASDAMAQRISAFVDAYCSNAVNEFNSRARKSGDLEPADLSQQPTR